jgi:hypothetical protein
MPPDEQQVAELSDADVGLAPPPAAEPHELSDADVGLASSPPDPSRITAIMHAFGQGFGEGAGDERYGLSDESIAAARKAGLFRGEGQSPLLAPLRAFNEELIMGRPRRHWTLPGDFPKGFTGAHRQPVSRRGCRGILSLSPRLCRIAGSVGQAAYIRSRSAARSSSATTGSPRAWHHRAAAAADQRRHTSACRTKGDGRRPR